MLENNDILLDDVLNNDFYEIEEALIKRKFEIQDYTPSEMIIANKTTFRGYNIRLEIEKIKGTKLFRMTTRTTGAEKEFKKLKEILKSKK